MYKNSKKLIFNVGKNLFLIKLIPPIPGFKDFVGVWVYKSCNFNILIDVGPASTINQLLDSLNLLGISNLNYIFLTHIHLDHAGSIGKINNLINENTSIICHKMGIKHLNNPKTLWNKSIKTLGKIGSLYKIPTPIKKINNFPINTNILETPGHSPHHICIMLKNYIFLGESAGIFLKLNSGEIYMRPATPPYFHTKTYFNSIKQILKIKPKILCYGHLGIVPSSLKTIQAHQKQLKSWYNTINKKITNNRNKYNKKLIKNCISTLIKNDPNLAPIKYMDKSSQKRELFFIHNTISGLIENIIKNKTSITPKYKI